MNEEIRQALLALKRVPTSDLSAAHAELGNLLAALRKEIEAQSNLLNEADSTHAAYTAAAGDLVGLLQLSQAVIEAQSELGKLKAAAEKAMQKVWKKAPK